MIAVFGSLNMDFVVRVEHLPAPGETVLGSGFITLPGGKGANQAYAAARLVSTGGSVRMIGAVGQDVLGERLRQNLASVGVDVTRVREDAALPTGMAFIPVDAQGQNSIVVAPGVNGALGAPDPEVFRGIRVVLCQLETPLDSVTAALRLARAEGATTILDPAPAQPLPAELLREVDILTPNETEALALLGRVPGNAPSKPPGTIALADADAIARQLGPATVILKLGAQGCWARGRHYPPFAVEVVDTTAAGDTFNAALACALAEQQPWERAIRFANAAAALSITKHGAQASAPTRQEVEALLAA